MSSPAAVWNIFRDRLLLKTSVITQLLCNEKEMGKRQRKRENNRRTRKGIMDCPDRCAKNIIATGLFDVLMNYYHKNAK